MRVFFNSIRVLAPIPNAYRVAGMGTGRSLSPICKRKSPTLVELLLMESGNVLLSRAVSSQVPSALKGLTSVFGMGTGGSLSPLSPECFVGSVQSLVLLASTPSLYNRSLHLGNFPHIKRTFLYLAHTLKTAHPDCTSCYSLQPLRWPLLSSIL